MNTSNFRIGWPGKYGSAPLWQIYQRGDLGFYYSERSPINSQANSYFYELTRPEPISESGGIAEMAPIIWIFFQIFVRGQMKCSLIWTFRAAIEASFFRLNYPFSTHFPNMNRTDSKYFPNLFHILFTEPLGYWLSER
jgi:hypothetical protein